MASTTTVDPARSGNFLSNESRSSGSSVPVTPSQSTLIAFGFLGWIKLKSLGW